MDVKASIPPSLASTIIDRCVDGFLLPCWRYYPALPASGLSLLKLIQQLS